jgi:hypothetical protein
VPAALRPTIRRQTAPVRHRQDGAAASVGSVAVGTVTVVLPTSRGSNIMGYDRNTYRRGDQIVVVKKHPKLKLGEHGTVIKCRMFGDVDVAFEDSGVVTEVPPYKVAKVRTHH